MQRNCTNQCTLLHEDWEQKALHFLCVSLTEQHEKCNKFAPIIVLGYIKIENKSTKSTTNHCIFIHKDWERSQSLCNKVN